MSTKNLIKLIWESGQMTMEILALVIFIPLLLLVILTPIVIREVLRESESKRWLRETTLLPDNQGNYPARYFSETGHFYQPEGGNSCYPPTYVILPHGTPSPKLEKLPPTANSIKIKSYQNFKTGDIQEEEQTTVLESFEPELIPERSESDILALLTGAKIQKGGKHKSIENITGWKPGAGKEFTYYSQLWDSIKV
jgi:hypothetical protein